MKINIIAVGKIKENWLKEAVNFYQKRLLKFAEVNILEIPDLADEIPEARALLKEAAMIEAKLPDKGFLILCDLHTKAITSEQLAVNLEEWFELGGATVNFVIGSSRGLDDSLRRRANARLKLSDLTFPHQLARVILLEQLFRAFKINNNESYHK